MEKEVKQSDILREIKQTERESEASVAKAQIEKDKIIQQSRKTCSQLLKDSEEQNALTKENKIAAAQKKAEQQRKEMIEVSKKSVVDMSKTAQKNMEKATDFIIKTFEESL